MEDKLATKPGVSNSSAILSIKDCLKMIGVQEVTANVFALPSKKKTKATA